MCINFRLKYADIGEIAVFFVVIEAKSDNEFVGNDLAEIVGGKVDDAARGFVEHSAGLNASCARQLEVVNKVGKGASAVDDILNNNDVKVCHINTVKFENGVVGTYYNIHGRYSPFHITVMTTKQTRSFVIDTLRIYQPMLREICKEVALGSSKMVDVEPILNCTEAMLCCKKSRDEFGGAEVTIDQLDENDKFDGYAHEAAYAANAGVIYKD